jgi:hypothetical protein
MNVIAASIAASKKGPHSFTLSFQVEELESLVFRSSKKIVFNYWQPRVYEQLTLPTIEWYFPLANRCYIKLGSLYNFSNKSQ